MADHTSGLSPSPKDVEKLSADHHGADVDMEVVPCDEKEQQQIHGLETSPDTSLQRDLKARNMSMIAIGGAMMTGLVIGTGKALAQSGPGSVFIAFTVIGFIVFLVMAARGEMASWLPMSAEFTGYASRFCDSSLGFALGWW